MKLISMQIFAPSLMVLISLSFFDFGNAKTVERSIVDNIHTGIKYAGKMLGIDTASDVADLVSRAFSNTIQNRYQTGPYQKQNTPENENNEPSDTESATEERPPLVSGLFRLMGLDASKLGALALNGLLFIAQMIGRTLLTPNIKIETESSNENEEKPRNLNFDTPMDWILTNKNSNRDLNKLLIKIRDKNLPQNLIDMVKKIERNNGDGDCIKLLLCKSAPFIWSMQNAINDRIDGTFSASPLQNGSGDDQKNNRLNVMFQYLPDMNEFKIHGDACEESYHRCQIYKMEGMA